MNIVYINSHDTGRLIQPHGYPVPTPAYQRMADEGVFFRNTHCVGPTCSPSRAGLLTGQWPHQCGMYGLAHRGFSLNDPQKHLAHYLREQGYHSVLAQFEHTGLRILSQTNEDLGYHEWVNTAEPGVWWGGCEEGKTVPGLREIMQKHEPGGQPFYIEVAFQETHRDFPHAGHADDPRYVAPLTGYKDTPEHRQDVADFNSMLRTLDRKVGEILDLIDQTGHADDTLVLLTTDHGVAFPGMKCSLRDTGTGVLMLMRGPKGCEALRGGKVVDELVSHVDVYPTICEVLGVPVPEWCEGHSLLPLASGQVETVREELFSEVTYHAAYEPKRMVRTMDFKYIRRYGEFNLVVRPNIDDGYSKTLWDDEGLLDDQMPREALYDLNRDPGEFSNVIDDPRYADVLADLRGRLDQWMKETNDPLLEGDVPAPKGAKVNPQGQNSPNDEPVVVE